MKLGLSLPMFTDDPERPLAAAARAAAAGYDAVFAPDHLFPPGAPDRPSLEPFTTLSAIATRQPGLGVGTLVTRASIRPAGLLAKQAAALDQMSGGGGILGLGAGDAVSKAEHETFGLPFPPAAVRVEILEETVLAVRTLFEGKPWEGGRHVPAVAGPLLPPGRPAIWVGGRSDAVLAVAARTADAWNGWAMDAAAFAAASERLTELADGRPVEPTWGGIVLVGEDENDLERLTEERRNKGLPMDVWSGTVAELRDFVAELGDAGCTWVVAIPAGGKGRLELVRSVVPS